MFSSLTVGNKSTIGLTQRTRLDANGTSGVGIAHPTCRSSASVLNKTLSTCTHSCPPCGYVEDRDVNHAINIVRKAWAGFTKLPGYPWQVSRLLELGTSLVTLDSPPTLLGMVREDVILQCGPQPRSFV